MHNSAVIRLIGSRLAWYPPGATAEPRWLEAPEEREALRNAVTRERLTPCFAAPAAQVRLLRLELGTGERKHIAQSLPFLLEEQVASDIEQLHFAFTPLDRDHIAVAICALRDMERWQAQLADFPGVHQWLPEPLLLPWREGEWCVVREGDAVTLRLGAAEGLGAETAMLPLLLEAALAERDAPAGLVFYGADQEADLALLPATLRERAQWRRGGFAAALMLGGSGQVSLNLLQGVFSPRLPLGRWWREWRAVAAVFGIAFALQLVATGADYLALKRDNEALRAAITDSYRRAYPQGAVVDPEKQLQRQLAALRGSGETSGFTHLMEQVGAAVAGSGDTAVTTINYNDKSGEMRLSILAADFDTVEQIRADINRAGLKAVMESSSAQGGRVSARLRVGES